MFIESKDLPVAEPVKVGRYHQLAEWMREGAKRTKQCRLMNFTVGEDGLETCAMAAAAVGAGHDLLRLGLSVWAVANVDIEIRLQIVNMNDARGWSREQIADFLCREGGCEHGPC